MKLLQPDPTNKVFQCTVIETCHIVPLKAFFDKIKSSKIPEHFHPHSFSSEAATLIANYKGKDFYAVILLEGMVVGYGMLRGWDEGYDIPSLGIVISPEKQGLGLGKLLMHYLHCYAKLKGSKKILLKVYLENKSAINLYKQMGYIFDGEESGQLIAFKML